MSSASELRAEAIGLFDLIHRGRSSNEKPDHEALKVVTETASAWRSQGLLSYAGLAMAQAPDLAWGDGKLVRQIARSAIKQLIEAANQKPLNGWDAIAGTVMLRRGSLYMYADMDTAERRTAGRRLGAELAERLMTITTCDYEDHILVSGFNIVTEFDGEWNPEFPSYEPASGGMLYEPGRVVFGVPSAFRLMIDAGDYYAANKIAIRRPSAFVTPSSLGWRAAVAGFVTPPMQPSISRKQPPFSRATCIRRIDDSRSAKHGAPLMPTSGLHISGQELTSRVLGANHPISGCS